jgi:hypothetical protein
MRSAMRARSRWGSVWSVLDYKEKKEKDHRPFSRSPDCFARRSCARLAPRKSITPRSRDAKFFSLLPPEVGRVAFGFLG